MMDARIVNEFEEGGMVVIDFDEELTKFKPSLEINRAEDVIHKSDMTDVSDIIKELLDEVKAKN